MNVMNPGNVAIKFGYVPALSMWGRTKTSELYLIKPDPIIAISYLTMIGYSVLHLSLA